MAQNETVNATHRRGWGLWRQVKYHLHNLPSRNKNITNPESCSEEGSVQMLRKHEGDCRGSNSNFYAHVTSGRPQSPKAANIWPTKTDFKPSSNAVDVPGNDVEVGFGAAWIELLAVRRRTTNSFFFVISFCRFSWFRFLGRCLEQIEWHK